MLHDFPTPLTRRDLLRRAGAGFGMLGLAGALDAAGLLAAETPVAHTPGSPKPHFPPKAKRVIALFMNGGPSHVDTFDPKPALKAHVGEKPEVAGKAPKLGLMPSPFAFAAHGRSGIVMSELFPNLAKCADDLCVIRSMHADTPNHEPALLLMHSGHQQPTRPCMGSWVSYGLGGLNQNLPAFVVLAPGRPVVGPQLWSSSFLPGAHQGMAVNTADMRVGALVPNLAPPAGTDPAARRRQLDLIHELNRLHLDQRPEDAALEAQVMALETAAAMQTEAAEAFDVSKEPAAVREAYGRSAFGQSCLLARRLAERGVRFVQVYYTDPKNKQPWDTHQDNDKRHKTLCPDSDRATTALLTDLKRRGLLDDTLVVWGGEFGRTPYAQPTMAGSKKAVGRDHHHTGFTMILAGGGVRAGLTYGATDELGMHAVENRVHVHDLHATILHLLGLDHERLTFRYSGRDFRLTDVYGRVVHDIIA
jgi:hypothetical protein